MRDLIPSCTRTKRQVTSDAALSSKQGMNLSMFCVMMKSCSTVPATMASQKRFTVPVFTDSSQNFWILVSRASSGCPSVLILRAGLLMSTSSLAMACLQLSTGMPYRLAMVMSQPSMVAILYFSISVTASSALEAGRRQEGLFFFSLSVRVSFPFWMSRNTGVDRRPIS